MDRLTDGADRLGEIRNRMMPRHVAGLEVHLGGTVIIAGDEAVEDFGEEQPFLRPEPAHDAEVDSDQETGVVDEQVARMHVGVEETVAQCVPQEGLDHRAAEVLEIEALGDKSGAVVEVDGLDPLQRQDVARGAVPVHGRHAEIGIVLGVLRHFG